MNRRIAMSTALCATVLAASAFVVPTAHAGNVAWGVSIGAPGFSVAVGQPAYYGGRGYYRAPFVPVARPYWRPYYRAARLPSGRRRAAARVRRAAGRIFRTTRPSPTGLRGNECAR